MDTSAGTQQDKVSLSSYWYAQESLPYWKEGSRLCHTQTHLQRTPVRPSARHEHIIYCDECASSSHEVMEAQKDGWGSHWRSESSRYNCIHTHRGQVLQSGQHKLARARASPQMQTIWETGQSAAQGRGLSCRTHAGLSPGLINKHSPLLLRRTHPSRDWATIVGTAIFSILFYL